ncbi:hypothetical protein C8J57DRAFT_1143440 [Mycena rebaudengoi]|nr:hypothetical protein C8J57DRAFT_1143440 [Mycena rebaudengoi]
MHLSLIFGFTLLAVPLGVAACEGECIVGVTEAFLSKYKTPVAVVMKEIGQTIITRLSLVPDGSTSVSPEILMSPMAKAYKSHSYDVLECNIFPSYFHGKCLVDGVEPKGCPNPDCPVVCGTPGSLVHFYPTLRYIAYNSTRSSLESVTSPSSESYIALEKMVLQMSTSPGPRMLRYTRRVISASDTSSVSPTAKREETIKKILKEILAEIGRLLWRLCGGTYQLPHCSWETEMKERILSYP